MTEDAILSVLIRLVEKPAFQAFAKPYFDKGNLSLQLHWNAIFISINEEMAWFDEC
jgi:hypothetical protein